MRPTQIRKLKGGKKKEPRKERLKRKEKKRGND